jgi:hypothetical protein
MVGQSLSRVLPGEARAFWRPRRQTAVGIAVVLFAIWLSTVMADTDSLLPALWFLGIAFGFTLQRSRFCFASAFRDLFLFGSARKIKAIMLGLAIASLGFAVIMYNEVPFPAFGALPTR